MNRYYVVFWSVMIFASIAWYFFLLFYLGVKGGYEIVRMTKALSKPADQDLPSPEG
jgi:membrane-bound acyltransferase YfiQ involved in biofilm formation